MDFEGSVFIFVFLMTDPDSNSLFEGAVRGLEALKHAAEMVDYPRPKPFQGKALSVPPAIKRKGRPPRVWPQEEQAKFLQVAKQYSPNWQAIFVMMKPKTMKQCKWLVDSLQVKYRNQGLVFPEYLAKLLPQCRWTETEKHKFFEGMDRFGKDWYCIATYIETKNVLEVQRYASRFTKLLRKYNAPVHDALK